MNAGIYQAIWDADQHTNGVPALRPGEPKSETAGYVVVDERDTSVSGEHMVLAEVRIPESKRETYRLCEKLFNNYTLDPGIREQVALEETQEEMDFVDAIVSLPPLQVAKDFIARDRGQAISDNMLAAMIKETWFLQDKAGSKHASGFEHVFVGEQKDTGDKPDEIAVEAGGYHFWYKYHLDDAGKRLDTEDPTADRIVYLGTRYGNAEVSSQGLLVPEVVTLSFEWTAPDFTRGGSQRLRKPIGGFWVGCSPEGLIALGLIRARTQVDKIAEINSAIYQVDLHRLDGNPKSIRTFFPRFRHSNFGGMHPPGDGSGGGGSQPSEHEVKIVAALVNLPGDESGRETVTLLNAAPTPANLEGWAIEAPNGWRFMFADVVLSGGEVRTFRMPTTSPQFRNRAGDITLFDRAGMLHHQVHYTTEAVRREGFTTVF
jgi:hypothetical protein